MQGRKRKREFVCHAITFKRWWHVSKSLSVAPLPFFVFLLVTFSLFFLSAFTVPSQSSPSGLPLVSVLSKTCLVVTPSSFNLCAFLSFTHTWYLSIHLLALLLWVTISLSTFLPQLPGEVASLQAHVRCCPMCTAEGTDPRSGRGVPGTGGGHGVRTQGSGDGYRRGMDGRNKSRGYDSASISDDCLITTSFIIYCCHHFLYVLQLLAFISLLCISPSKSVPAPVQESSLELFHHRAWNQYIWQSHEPRCVHYWTSWLTVGKSIHWAILK